MLNAERMATNIRRLVHILKKNGLIVDESLWVMKEAASNVESCPPDQWELCILPEKPLEFVQAESDDRLKPDIFCLIRVASQGDWPISHLSVVLRVWSTRQNISFRPDWDSEEVKQKFDRIGSYKRVMFRCHYDTCSHGQHAPIFHLQFGGHPRHDELYWFPHTLELPRFPSPPVDLILACELVVATFFPSVHRKLCQDGNWTSMIQESELFFMNKFYEVCKNYLNHPPQHQTLLDHICSLMP